MRLQKKDLTVTVAAFIVVVHMQRFYYDAAATTTRTGIMLPYSPTIRIADTGQTLP